VEKTTADGFSLQLEPIKGASSDVADAPLHPDQVNRLWQHGMYKERLFHDRLNYFSAVQTGLLGVFAILYHKEPALGVFAPLTAVGLAFAPLVTRAGLSLAVLRLRQ
jgi:hypothetical protein